MAIWEKEAQVRAIAEAKGERHGRTDLAPRDVVVAWLGRAPVRRLAPEEVVGHHQARDGAHDVQERRVRESRARRWQTHRRADPRGVDDADALVRAGEEDLDEAVRELWRREVARPAWIDQFEERVRGRERRCCAARRAVRRYRREARYRPRHDRQPRLARRGRPAQPNRARLRSRQKGGRIRED